MSELSEGRKFHAEAAQARESRDTFGSLGANDRALFAYAEAGDSAGLAEGIACRAITMRVEANLRKLPDILVITKHELLAAVEIAESTGDLSATVLPLYNLGRTYDDLGDYTSAVTTYTTSIDRLVTNPPPGHDISPMQLDMQNHLAVAEYRLGDTSAIQRAEDAVIELSKIEDTNNYNKDVWVSGGYMRMADALRSDDSEKAQEYLAKAKTIIEANPELKPRKEQWHQLAETFK